MELQLNWTVRDIDRIRIRYNVKCRPINCVLNWCDSFGYFCHCSSGSAAIDYFAQAALVDVLQEGEQPIL